MTKRAFYQLGFAPEDRIGNAVELETYDLAGFSPESIHDFAKAGKPMPGFDHLILCEGRRIAELPSGITLTVNRCKMDPLNFDVVVNPLGWRILSNRLGHALRETAPNDVELLPVTISGLEGEIIRADFCVVNILQMLDAISETKTVRSRDKKSVLKLAVIESKVPLDVHAFRVKEWRWAFLVDDVAKRALSRQPHDGLVFIPVEKE